MTETPGVTPPAGPTSERMQALLAQFQEEQVTEQRSVSTLLTSLRTQVAALTEGVRLAASDASVERLEGVVTTVVSDLRTSTSLLGQRIEALSKRVDAVAQETAAPTEQAAVRLAALSADITAQAEAVDQMRAALEALAGFPSALALLQQDVAGLHDRLQPLAEVRAAVGDVGARTSTALDALRPQLESLQNKVDALTARSEPERVRDAVVDALSGRLDRLEEAAGRPVVGPDALRSDLGDLRASLDSAMGDRVAELAAGLRAVENRLGQVGERLADVGDAAGGVPALATDLTRLAARVEELHGLHDDVRVVGQGVAALREDSTGTALALGLASLRDDVERLAAQVAESAPQPLDELAAAVSQRVADRLVETLAPRIADVVLTRVSAALVNQLGEALSPRMRADTELVVRTATADSERRVLAHVDEAVLALAEALLRRRRGGRPAAGLALPQAEQLPEPEVEPDEDPQLVVEEPVVDVLDRLNALEEAEAAAEAAVLAAAQPPPADEAAQETDTPQPPAASPPEPAVQPAVQPAAPTRPAVTTGLAPAAARRPAPAPAPAARPADPSAQPDLQPAPPKTRRAQVPAMPKAAPEPAPQAEPEAVPQAEPEAAPEAAPKAADVPGPRAAPRARSKPVAPPAKKAIRPASKPASKPILDRTPDLTDDDDEPVRGPGGLRPVTRSPQRPAPQPPVPAQPPAATPAVAPPALPSAKRKPWWRPGG
jgi:hypothetical protein